MRHRVLTLIVCCVCQAPTASVTGVEQDSPDRATQLRAIRADFEAAFLKAVIDMAKAPEADKAQYREALYSQTLRGYIRKAMDLIGEKPADDVSFAALVWVMEQQAAWNIVAPKQHPKLLELIEKHHLSRPDLAVVIYWLPWLQLAEDDKASGERKTKFVTRLMDESKHKPVRGLACFTLAERSFWDYERATTVASPDPKVVAEAAGRAERLFVRVEKEFADIPFDRLSVRKDLDEFLQKIRQTTGKPLPEPKPLKPLTLGQQASAYLNEIRHLAIGQPAPSLAGDDLGGAKLSLADQKGKVVVVTFWASWCGPCMVRVPSEIELVKRLRGKPFVFIGVNGDENKETAVKAEQKMSMNWRSVWAGQSEESPLMKTWNVRKWPTVYVIDHTGVIRGKDLHGKELDRLVDTLIADAEKALAPKKE